MGGSRFAFPPGGGAGAGVSSIAKFGDTPLTGAVTLSEGTSISLTQVGNDIEIAATGGGTGDVVGPASATDDAIARFDLTTGKLIQNSVVTIADTTGDMAGVGTINTLVLPTSNFVGLTDTQTLSGKTLTAPRFANGGFIADANGNELIGMNTTASAVNNIAVTNGATGFAPTISAEGGDTDITLYVKGKGTGSMVIADGNSVQILEGVGVASAVNYMVLSNAAAGNDPTFTATGASTDIDINMVPKGTGRLQSGGVTVPTISSSDTLTNKTLTTPTIASFANANHNHQNAAGGGTLANAALTNSSITIGSTSVALGATAATVAGLTLTSPTITTSPTAAGATWTSLGTVTTIDINGGTIDGTVIGGASAAAITGTAIVGNSFVPNLSTIPSNGLYLPAANTLGWAVNSAAEMQLTSTALSPAADGGSSLGTTALGWQNLFANTGFVINIENGNWVATHTSGILTVGTGDLRVTNNFTNATSVVTLGGAQTLTNKTLTSPVVNQFGTASGLGAAWTSYTPTWTNLTATSSTQNSSYLQIGKMVIVRLNLVFGASTAVTGDVTFTLPVTAASGYSNFQSLGTVNLNDATNLLHPATIAYATTTTAHIYVENAAGTYTSFAALSSTVPFTWTTSDGILGTFTYEAA